MWKNENRLKDAPRPPPPHTKISGTPIFDPDKTNFSLKKGTGFENIGLQGKMKRWLTSVRMFLFFWDNAFSKDLREFWPIPIFWPRKKQFSLKRDTGFENIGQ